MPRSTKTHKVKRLSLYKFRQMGIYSNGHPKLEIYLKSDNGSFYVWTPILREETLRMFQIACQVKNTQQAPKKVELENYKPDSPDYLSLAIKAGKKLYQKTSLSHVKKIAKDMFRFDLAPPVHVTMPDIVAQEIYEWIITLAIQPISDEEKLKLIDKFARSIMSCPKQLVPC